MLGPCVDGEAMSPDGFEVGEDDGMGAGCPESLIKRPLGSETLLSLLLKQGLSC